MQRNLRRIEAAPRNVRRITGQQGSARRRLFWEEEGAISTAPAIYPPWWNANRIGAAPQRPPARPGGSLPGDRRYTPRESRREVSHTLDDRPAYRGGGYGFPHPGQISEEGAGSRWHRGSGARISQELAPVVPTFWKALLGGLGIATGFLVIKKVAKG
ncbi:hypothetical protein LCGC14_1645170 [marine sediment metagenome]|uniref:Uncharacterized protein n=1 Tax=marine sediment metagenome TaxID=412755 RepID=A0A0F9KYA4_9ZZZZ